MATVYLARDVKHNRKVALKVLKPDLGAIVGVDRFLSEIEVTANLQHPNLLPLFDSGAADGLLFYVMPYVEGESLRARLDREKQLPVEEAVRIASAVASALDYAHRRGVIHRDLKPENILLHEGQPLVADFGIALAVSNAGGNRVTQTGLSLGTPQYMSPEQATGDRAIDARTDVYSLGAVTYEMLAGEPPHTGSSSQAVIARLLTERPRAVRATRPSVPAHVEAVVEHALEKLPADRFGSAREFADALSGARPITIVDRPVAAASVPAPRRRVVALLPWAVALVATAIAGSVLVRQKPPQTVPVRFSLELPDQVEVNATFGARVALSPDGTQLVFTGRSPGGSIQLYLRRLADPTPLPLRGTEGASNPSFSPDGQALVFASGIRGSNGRGLVLKTLPISGGNARDIARDVSGSASWVNGEHLVFVVDRGLDIVSSDGASRRTVLKGSLTQIILWVDALPDGKNALVTYATNPFIGPGTTRIGIVSLDDGRLTDLGVQGTAARYAAPGYLLFGRAAGELVVAPFSLRSSKVTGPPVLLFQDVGGGPLAGFDYAVSQNGTLAYVMASTRLQPNALFVVDRGGSARQLTRDSAAYAGPRVSPDGRRVAYSTGGSPANGTGSDGVFVYDVATGTSTPLSTDSNSYRPEWTADGSTILYRQQLADSALLWSRPWNMSGAPQVVGRGPSQGFMEVGPGPRSGFTIIRNRSAGPNGDYPTEIVMARTDSLGVTRPLFSRAASVLHPRVSPSGRLLAYSSNEGQRTEVYVMPLPGPGPRVQVSTNGGSEPAWSRDGTQVYYRSGRAGGDGWMMSASIGERPELAVTRRDSLFVDTYIRNTTHTNYDVFPDGRLLMLRAVGPTATQRDPLFVVLNWPQLIEKAAP
jgi:serine/threonine-protein kinase